MSMDEELICPVCGKAFVREKGKHSQKYCSIECGNLVDINRKKKIYENNKEELNRKRREYNRAKKLKESSGNGKLSISEVDALADKKGLSYGQYVAKYGV